MFKSRFPISRSRMVDSLNSLGIEVIIIPESKSKPNTDAVKPSSSDPASFCLTLEINYPRTLFVPSTRISRLKSLKVPGSSKEL